MSDINFAIPGLMRIATPRADDNDSEEPLMNIDYAVPGLMEIQTPIADEVSSDVESG